MTGEIKASLPAAVAVALLAACASQEPVPPAPAGAGAPDETAAEYQRLVDNAREQRVCKKQTVLGTRVPTVICMTQAELKAEREHRDEVMHDLQANAPGRAATPDRPPPPPPGPSLR